MATWPRPVVLGPRFGLTFDCPKVTVPPTIRHTDPETYTYVSVPPDTQNVLRFARNLRTYQVSSWGRAYNSGLVDSTHFCLADEAVKEKTITQRCSMYVRTYLFLFGLKNQLKEARGQEAPTPLDTDQLSSCSYYCLSPGGAFHGTVWNSTYVRTYTRTYVFPFLFFTVFQFSLCVAE